MVRTCRPIGRKRDDGGRTREKTGRNLRDKELGRGKEIFIYAPFCSIEEKWKVNVHVGNNGLFK